VLTAGYGQKLGQQLEQQAGHESGHGSSPAWVGQGASAQADLGDIAEAELAGEDQGQDEERRDDEGGGRGGSGRDSPGRWSWASWFAVRLAAQTAYRPPVSGNGRRRTRTSMTARVMLPVTVAR